MSMCMCEFFPFRIATIKKKKNDSDSHTTAFFAVTNPSRSGWAVQAALPAPTRLCEMKVEQKNKIKIQQRSFSLFFRNSKLVVKLFELQSGSLSLYHCLCVKSCSFIVFINESPIFSGSFTSNHCIFQQWEGTAGLHNWSKLNSISLE